MATERGEELTHEPIRLVIDDDDWVPNLQIIMWEEDGENIIVPKHRFVNGGDPFFATRYFVLPPADRVFHRQQLVCHDGSVQEVVYVKKSAEG